MIVKPGKTLTVGEVIAQLQSLPPSAPCLIYVDEAEEFGVVEKVQIILTQDEMPYAKGDQPDVGVGSVLIRGWIA